MIKKQLTGHDSADTAYVVDDYPYGFKLRTSIRYWIETAGRKGQRFVSQTKDPKRGVWNKPKASTYSPVVVMGLDEKEHVVTAELSIYADKEQIEAFKAYKLDAHQAHYVDGMLAAHARKAQSTSAIKKIIITL